jgi:hypothetical protein
MFSNLSCKTIFNAKYSPAVVTLVDSSVLDGYTTDIVNASFIFKDKNKKNRQRILNSDVQHITKTMRETTLVYERIACQVNKLKRSLFRYLDLFIIYLDI